MGFDIKGVWKGSDASCTLWRTQRDLESIAFENLAS